MAADGSGPAAMVISAIAGTAGMGKTSLAVRWAHRVRDRFPDGQLYVNLRGYDAGPPVTPEQALDGFLRALGVPAEAIPAGVEAMAGYYRSMLTGRRMLVVLDNVANADQVRPLLPASPTCVVLATSRSRLSGLVARDGARRATLDFLPHDEALTLLRGVIGADRTDSEPEATAELARLLDRLASVHLLEETGPDRYCFHDLLRAYAADRAALEESDVELHDANARILGWYLHSADAAVRILWPNQPNKTIALPPMDFRPPALATSEEARHWLASEHSNLMAIIHHAATTGWHTLAWQLPLILVDYFIQGSHWVDLVVAQQIGLAAARHAGDREAEYWALTCLSEAYLELERFDEAVPPAEDALALTREIDNRRGQGVALHDLGWALERSGPL